MADDELPAVDDPPRAVDDPPSAGGRLATEAADPMASVDEPAEPPVLTYCRGMASLDVDEMLARFRDRAAAVKRRPLPPVAGEERQAFIAQAQLDFQDFAIIGDARRHHRGRRPRPAGRPQG